MDWETDTHHSGVWLVQAEEVILKEGDCLQAIALALMSISDSLIALTERVQLIAEEL